MLSYIAWIAFWPFLRFFIKPEGINNIPRVGPLVVVANHIHELDPWKFGPFMPFGLPIHWFAKKELYSVWDNYQEQLPRFRFKPFAYIAAILITITVKYSLTIPVDRENPRSKTNRDAIKQANSLLSNGRVIGIFGEGGIGKEGEVSPIFVSLAKKHQALILPVKIEKGRVIFGQTVSLASESRSSEEVAREIMDNIYRM